jgi:hypothetical protein
MHEDVVQKCFEPSIKDGICLSKRGTPEFIILSKPGFNLEVWKFVMDVSSRTPTITSVNPVAFPKEL